MNSATSMRTGWTARLTVMLLTIVLGGSTGYGQSWAKKMFDHTTYDFRSVAKGAKAEHVFTVENIYEEDMYISTVRSTCGCTTPRISKRLLKTWEKAEITAELDTRGFDGQKDSTLTVVFGGRFPAEVRLQVHAYIRRDIVVQPGVIRFGSVAQGNTARQKVTVEYAGRSDWQIIEVESANPHLQGRVVQTQRDGGRVTYDLYATLSADTPVGFIREHLILVTNDPNPRTFHVPVAVEGVVTAAVTAQPSPLSGGVEAGKTLRLQLFVRGRTPFGITAVRCGDPRFTYTVRKAGDDKSYLVFITFAAGQVAEEVNETIRIETDLAAKVLEVPVHVLVSLPQTATF